VKSFRTTKKEFTDLHIIYSDQFLVKKSAGISQDSVTMYNKLKDVAEVSKLSEVPQHASRKFLYGVLRKLGLPFNLPYEKPGIFWLEQFSSLSMKRRVTFIRTHDIFPITNPEWFRYLTTIKFYLAVTFQLRKDPVLVYDSEATRIEFEKFKKCNGVVVWCEPTKKNTSLCSYCDGCRFLKSRFQKKYAISVGTIEPRKNYSLLLQIAESAEKKNVPLHFVVVGRYGWKSQKEQKDLIRRSNSNVTWLSNACDASVGMLILNCAVFISTSINEGFGLPAVESRLQDCNLVLSDIPVYREIHGESNSVSLVALSANPEMWLERVIHQSSQEKCSSLTWSQVYRDKCKKQTNELMTKLQLNNSGELMGGVIE
jgi:glycosyltransferase involved in cell wall biosynthesis